MRPNPILQVCVFAEDGDVVLRISAGLQDQHEYLASLTVRNPEREQQAEITLTYDQAMMLSDMLQRIPVPSGDWE